MKTENTKTFERLSSFESIKQAILDDENYKSIIKESYGWIMYDLANKNKYNTKKILWLWDILTEWEKDACDWIINWLFDFIQ